MKNCRRVGVFFCTCKGRVTEKVDYKPIIAEVKKLPQVEYVRETPFLCTQPEEELVFREIVENNLNRVVIVGCAEPRVEGVFREVIARAGLNRHLMSMADLMGCCCAVHDKGPQSGKKALEIIKMGVARVDKLEEVMTSEVTVQQKVLVIGGGLAGIETALETAARGLKVILIEKEDKLGGRLAKINSILGSERIPAFLMEDKISAVNSNPLIEVRTNTKLHDLDGNIGDFTAWLVSGGAETAVSVGAIVLAVGLQAVFCPVKYGLGMADNVIGQMKLERMLADGKDFNLKRISMVTGKDTEAFNLPFVIAVKNALLLRKKFNAVVNVFYSNIKVAGDNWEKMYTEARGAGVNFFRFEEDLEITVDAGEITVNYTDPFIKGKFPENCKVVSDYIILTENLLHVEGAEQLAKILRIDLAGDYFFSRDNTHFLPETTQRDGIYLVGSCQAPGFLNEIEMSALNTAEEIYGKLYANRVTIELSQPYVDAVKCVVCLTCYRCCPHGAITIEHGEQFNNLYKSAAQMNPLVCRRCGICASECPGKAIQLPDFTDDQILAQLEAMGVQP